MQGFQRRLIAVLLLCVCFITMPVVAYAVDAQNAEENDTGLALSVKDTDFWIAVGLFAVIVLISIGFFVLAAAVPPIFLLIIPTVVCMVWVIKTYLL